jgi:hypothetical protein
MSLEFKITKELATLNATAAEWQAFAQVINNTLPNQEFRQIFTKMIQALPGIYQLPVDALNPFIQIQTLEGFNKYFDELQNQYQQVFLQLASQPRHFANASHEHYMVLTTMKEIKSTYPILKRTFDNLYQFMDKWVTNDAWIIMGCDVVFKSFNRLLLEISTLKKQDPDEAWLIFDTSIQALAPQVKLMEQLVGGLKN